MLASEASIASAFYLLSFEQEYCLKKNGSRRTECYLGYFPPVKTIKEVVGAPLIGVSFQCGFHARCPGYPDALLFVIPPVPVKARGGERASFKLQALESYHK